jgi:hypothetical protein
VDRTLEQRLTEFLDREDRKIEEERLRQERTWRDWEYRMETLRLLREQDQKFIEQWKKQWT